MNFRVFAAGLVFLALFQLLVAAGVVLYVVHCGAPAGAVDWQDTAAVPAAACCTPQVLR